MRLAKAKRIPPKFHSRQHGLMTAQLVGWYHATDKTRADRFFTEEWDNEDLFQINLLETLYAVMDRDFECIHYPASGLRSKRTAAWMKRIGARAGVFDLWCGWKGAGEGWLELKANDNKLTPAQREFEAWLDATNQFGGIVRSISAALYHLHKWGAPLLPVFIPLAEVGKP
jgi:hypothetical protein